MFKTSSRQHRVTSCLIGLCAPCFLAQAQNTLSPAENTAGYNLLFNGSNLENWHNSRQAEVLYDNAKVKSDMPLGPRIEFESGSSHEIVTNKQYKNFDVKIDVLVPENSSGYVFVRHLNTGTLPISPATGPALFLCGPGTSECQIPIKSFGSSFDMFPVKDSLWKTWYHPPGTWNQIRIIAFDSNYAHYGNGKKLLEYKIGTPEFIDAYNQSRYPIDGNNGRYYEIHPGWIILAPHYGSGICFRNLKAKELASHPFLQEFPDGKWPDSLPQDFVFRDPPTTLLTGKSDLPTDFSARRAGPWETLLEFSSRPTDFLVLGIDGRAVAFRQLEPGKFTILRRQEASRRRGGKAEH